MPRLAPVTIAVIPFKSFFMARACNLNGFCQTAVETPTPGGFFLHSSRAPVKFVL